MFASGISDDGSTVVGWYKASESSVATAYKWTGSGFVGLSASVGVESMATACSSDGSVIVGWRNTTSGGRAFKLSSSLTNYNISSGLSSQRTGLPVCSGDGTKLLGGDTYGNGATTTPTIWTAQTPQPYANEAIGYYGATQPVGTYRGGYISLTQEPDTVGAFYDIDGGGRTLLLQSVDEFVNGAVLDISNALANDHVVMVGFGNESDGPDPRPFVYTLAQAYVSYMPPMPQHSSFGELVPLRGRALSICKDALSTTDARVLIVGEGSDAYPSASADQTCKRSFIALYDPSAPTTPADIGNLQLWLEANELQSTLDPSDSNARVRLGSATGVGRDSNNVFYVCGNSPTPDPFSIENFPWYQATELDAWKVSLPAFAEANRYLAGYIARTYPYAYNHQFTYTLNKSGGSSTNGALHTTHDGRFVLAVTTGPGTYELLVKEARTLRRKIANISIGTFGISGVTYDGAFGLIGGDANNDNYINTDDYEILSDSFDLGFGDSGYDERADFDGDEFVGTDDYLILSENFDTQGD